MTAEKLIFRKGLQVPADLDAGSEPQCDTEHVWQIPEHHNSEGRICTGSGGLVYTTDLTREQPPTTVCDFCSQEFTQ